MPRIQGSSARSASAGCACAPAGGRAGSARYIGSSSRCWRAMPSSARVRNETVMPSARSISPPRSSGSAVLGLGGLSDSSTAGWRGAEARDRQRHERRGGARKAARRRRPPRRPAIASSSASASASRARIASAWPTSASPASVSRTPRALRWTSVVPGLALERGDLLGDGGLREGERLGGGGERARVRRPRAARACGGRQASGELISASRNVICADITPAAHPQRHGRT